LSGNERDGGVDRVRFSIVITFHNQRQFIADALDSALQQKNAGFEVIAVDDASSDGSPEALRQYEKVAKVLCLEKNLHACGARNRGAALARGEYLVFLDGDDAFLPWALEVYERIVTEKNAAFLLTSMRWFEGTVPAAGERPKEIQLVEYGDYLRRDRGFGHSASAFVILRKAFEEVGGWLEGFFPMEDVELALRLGTAGRTVQVLSPATVLHRAHASNSIHNVAAFLGPTEELLGRERLGLFPGGEARRFERRALLGGVTGHWIKRATKVGLYSGALRLMGKGAPMVAASARRKLGKVAGKQQATETLAM
jgi:glycosyltransferase involved in cell wall biosynthesis